MNVEVLNSIGTRVIDISLFRSRRGIKVSVKVDPEIEAFFQQWGGGIKERPSYQRLWVPVQKDANPVLVWSYEVTSEMHPRGYNLFHTGGALMDETGNVNLSILRIIGAGEGVTFICESVMSTSELEAVALKLRKAAEQFYSEYVQPVHLNIFVGVRDVRGAHGG